MQGNARADAAVNITALILISFYLTLLTNHSSCVICATNNTGRGIHTPQAAHPPPDKPFDHVQLDFIKLTPSEGKRYCLVVVDMFSKWVEVFSTAKQDANAVAKAPIR